MIKCEGAVLVVFARFGYDVCDLRGALLVGAYGSGVAFVGYFQALDENSGASDEG